jgi:L-asparaginase
MEEKILIICTGGSIDKIYDTTLSNFVVGAPQADNILNDAGVTKSYEIISILRKDSLEISDKERDLIVDTVRHAPQNRILITHGTDTMIATALALRVISGKTIVITGAMQPAAFKYTDAAFNLGAAFLAVQALPYGVYIVMNGRIFDPKQTEKNLKANRFETRRNA